MTLNNDILKILCEFLEKCKDFIMKVADFIKKLLRIIESRKPIKVTNYRYHRDFYICAEYTYVPIFRRNMPYHRRNF